MPERRCLDSGLLLCWGHDVQYEFALTGDQCLTLDEFIGELEEWCRYGKATVIDEYAGVPVFVNEFWTSKQRAAHSLHEISYRACFKPQLPRFFITRLTVPRDVVFDPFMGRGTTLLEAALHGGRPWGTTSIRCLAYCLRLGWTRPPSRKSTPGCAGCRWTHRPHVPTASVSSFKNVR